MQFDFFAVQFEFFAMRFNFFARQFQLLAVQFEFFAAGFAFFAAQFGSNDAQVGRFPAQTSMFVVQMTNYRPSGYFSPRWPSKTDCSSGASGGGRIFPNRCLILIAVLIRSLPLAVLTRGTGYRILIAPELLV